MRFSALGLLVPVEEPHLQDSDHYKNRSKYPVRQVPGSIFNRLNQLPKKRVARLFPKSTGKIQIFADPSEDHSIHLEKDNIAYVNSLQGMDATHTVSPLLIQRLDDIPDKEILAHLMPTEAHQKWLTLLQEVRRFFHVGLLAPVAGTPVPAHQRYRNFSPDSYRYVPSHLYDRLEKILQDKPNKKQIRSLFPNIRGRVYLNTEITVPRRPFTVAGTNHQPNILASSAVHKDDEIIGEGVSSTDEDDEYEEIQGIASILTQDGKAVQSRDARTGAGNVTIQASVRDPELMEWTSKQVSEYRVSLKPLNPATASRKRDAIIPPLVRDGYISLPRRVSIEGNICSGKTQLLAALEYYCRHKPDTRAFHFIHEPVEIWSSFRENDKALLDLSSTEPGKYGFLF